jgi:uncharacterized protein
MAGFTIDLAALPGGASQVRVESRAPDLGLPSEGWVGPVVGVLDIERNGDRISLRGSLEASALVECVRCLKGYELSLRVPFEVFVERAGSGFRLDEEELERDNYMMFHDGRRLDLREEAREALLLELPMAPHCREDCLGLCPRCGADLNEGPCGCSAESHQG